LKVVTINLAATPSVVFGLLGLTVFLHLMHLPRSAPLVGGLVLALMALPLIIIAARNAIRTFLLSSGMPP
jgi:phosphate transport system permease protein